MVSTRVLQKTVCPVSMTSTTMPSERYNFFEDDRYSHVFGRTSGTPLSRLTSGMDWEREAHLDRQLGLLGLDVQVGVDLHAAQARESTSPSSFTVPSREEEQESAIHTFGGMALEPSLLHPVPSQTTLAEPKFLSASLSVSVRGAEGLARNGGIFDILREVIAAHTPGVEVSMVEVDVVTVKKCPEARQVDSCLVVDYHIDLSGGDCQSVSCGADLTEAALEDIAAALVDKIAVST